MNPFYQKQCSTTPAQKPPQAIPGKKSAGRLTEVTPLDFLEAVYCNPNLPLATRLRAAIEASPYKHPKLSATAIATMDGKSFAETLERAIERSKSSHCSTVRSNHSRRASLRNQWRTSADFDV
jgi:hypothetical protein